jgi:hypothetical protein
MWNMTDRLTPDSPLYKPILDALELHNFDTHELVKITGVRLSVLQGRLSRMKGQVLIVSVGRRSFMRDDFHAGSVNIWALPERKPPTATPQIPKRYLREFVELKRDLYELQKLAMKGR